VRALDAFGPAQETTIDFAEVNGEAFVNNVSLGLYARFISSETYREAKGRTVAEMLPELVGPGAPPFGLDVDCDGDPVGDVQVVEVSNNPYTLSSLAGFGSRARLDTGVLGVTTVSIGGAADVNRLIALEAAGHPERYEGWRQWTAPTLEVRCPPASAAALDGEARTWDPPLRFAVRPHALRVRIGLDQSGASPALVRTPVGLRTLVGLGRVVGGRPSGIVIGESEATHDRS
jgi:diacylglycerol kinase family enzyme